MSELMRKIRQAQVRAAEDAVIQDLIDQGLIAPPDDAPAERAKARLADMAPELLEALREAENALADCVPTLERGVAQLNYGRSVLAQARAAIEKATKP